MTKPRFDLSKFTNESLENDPKAFLQAAIEVADYYGFEGHDVTTDIGFCRYEYDKGLFAQWYSASVNVAKDPDWRCVNIASKHTPLEALSEWVTAIEAHLQKGGTNG